MAEKDKIFSSKIKYGGIFPFSEFYKFCYDFLSEDLGFDIVEDKYAEKLSGDSKNIDIEWTGGRGVTDYFKFEVKVSFKIVGLTNIEIDRGGVKEKSNKGSIEVGISGTIIRDPKGKFEATPFNKFLRGIYEKWVITNRISEYEGKLAGACNEFLSQTKAYLDLEGKR